MNRYLKFKSLVFYSVVSIQFPLNPNTMSLKNRQIILSSEVITVGLIWKNIVTNTGEGEELKKYYENEEYNLAFDRWTSLMAELVIKHAPEVLEKLDNMRKKLFGKVDYVVYANTQGGGKSPCIIVENRAA